MGESCAECRSQSGHKPWCSARGGSGGGTQRKDKQNFPKRPDDGRKKK